MIKVQRSDDEKENVRQAIHSINFSPEVLPFCAITGTETVAFGAPQVFGGCAVDRTRFRTRLPDDRWIITAYGVVGPGDVNGVDLDLVYTTDAIATVSLGGATFTGGAPLKGSLGPFDLFATPGVPQGETIPIVALRATKKVGGNATLAQWCIWIEFLPSKQ